MRLLRIRMKVLFPMTDGERCYDTLARLREHIKETGILSYSINAYEAIDQSENNITVTEIAYSTKDDSPIINEQYAGNSDQPSEADGASP